MRQGSRKLSKYGRSSHLIKLWAVAPITIRSIWMTMFPEVNRTHNTVDLTIWDREVAMLKVNLTLV